MQSVDRPHLAVLSSVRASLAPAIRAALPDAGDEVIAAIRDAVPEYAQPLEGRFGQAVRRGVREALRRFVDDIESPGADPDGWSEVYEELGRGELRQGRTLEALLGAYRIGARVSWRRIADAASRAGATAEELTALAEAIFAYIDEISALSADGYATEQTLAAGETQRRRAALVRALAGGAAPDAIAQAASAAGWEVPGTASALVTTGGDPVQLAAKLGLGAIGAQMDSDVDCVIVPDAAAPGRSRELERVVGSAPAGLGPEVEIGRIALSFERACLALDIARDERVMVRAEERLADIVLRRDRSLIADLRARELEGLVGETQLSQERLLETLSAWLDHPGRPTEVAKAIHVHPQTARYRLRKLRELIGDIDDPERRFRIAIALRGGASVRPAANGGTEVRATSR